MHYLCALFFYVFIFTNILFVTTSSADQMILNNGRVYSGHLIVFSRSECLFQTERSTIPFIQNEIVQLVTRFPLMLELKSGKILKGTVIIDEEGIVSIHMKEKGTRLFSIYEIERIFIPTHETENENTNNHIMQKQAKPTTFIGESEDDYFHTVFLRESAVLLKKGEKRLQTSLSYTYFDTTFLGQPIATHRNLSFTNSIDYGLFNGAEFYVSIPSSWNASTQPDQTKHTLHFGPLNTGFKYLLLPEKKNRPEFIVKFISNIPFKKDRYVKQPTRFFSDLTFFKSVDPVVISASIGSVLYSTDSIQRSTEIDNSETSNENDDDKNTQGKEVLITEKIDLFLSYSFNIGFSVNRSVTLSGGLSGLLKKSSRQKNESDFIPFTDEGLFFHSGLYYRLKKNQTISPSITFGLYNAMSSVNVDLSYSYTF